MSTSVLTNALLLFDGRDLTGQSNVVGIDYGAETQDDTSLADDTRSNIGGLNTAGFAAEGFFDAAMDADLFAAVGVSGSLISVAKGLTVGDRAYNLQAVAGDYQPIGGQVGEIAGYSLNASTRGNLQRGELLFHSSSEGATDDGSGLNAGAAASKVTAILHVFSASGSSPTLDVTVESDADNTFSTPATQITFSQATGRTAERIEEAGAVADAWWRVSFTIGGASPDFGFAVILILE